jgi:hypothetical protein
MVQSNHVDEKDGIWSFELSREEGTLRVIVLILTELGTVVKISSMPPHTTLAFSSLLHHQLSSDDLAVPN